MLELFLDLDSVQQVAFLIVCSVILFMLIDSRKRDQRESAMQAQIDELRADVVKYMGIALDTPRDFLEADLDSKEQEVIE